MINSSRETAANEQTYVRIGLSHMSRYDVGSSFERRVRWTREEIVAFATATGDMNPMHHDAAYAQTTRFGDLIPAGGHIVAAMMALCGSQATKDEPGVGLEFTFTLLGGARPDEEIVIRWNVVGSEESTKPRGTLVHLRGEARGDGERLLVSAIAKTLFVARL
jgi:3-hydroxybutyryl-CoA dehydratase